MARPVVPGRRSCRLRRIACDGKTDEDPLCDDRNPCTLDACAAGLCKSTPKNCDDGNTCTDDSCALPCTDSAACTVSDKCANALCLGSPKCNDDNPCTADTCVAGKCVGKAKTCDHGKACTTGDKCKAGTCVPTASTCPVGKTWKVVTSGFAFAPDDLAIAVGATVEFMVGGTHNALEVAKATWDANEKVALPGGCFVPNGSTKAIVFTKAGSYWCVCIPHADGGMKGKILVK